MKVSQDVWLERMNNLIERRKVGAITSQFKHVDDYGQHISKVHMGDMVLDVGCGSMVIKKHLPAHVSYTGIDPFPVNEQVIKMDIEECNFPDNLFQTVYAFAMLDNVYDLAKAIEQMKRVCSKNILILTGVNIPVDKYHTIEITENGLTELMKPFLVGYKEYLHPKIMLIEFIRPL